MNEYQRGLFFLKFFANKPDVARAFLNPLEIKDRYEFIAFLLRFSLTDSERRDVLINFLERYVFAYPEELTVGTVKALSSAYQNEKAIKYFLYYISISSKARQEVKDWARGYLQENNSFALHQTIADHLKNGGKKILVINNIKDGLGDELIRMGLMIQNFLDYNPEIRITLVTNRPNMYDNPRVQVVPISNGRNWPGFNETYDVVVDHFAVGQSYSLDFERNLKSSKVINSAFIYVRSNKSTTDFTFENVIVNGKNGKEEYVDRLGLRNRRVDNVYEASFRLLSEFGMPLRSEEDISQTGPLIAGTANPFAGNRWRQMMTEAGNELLQDGQYKDPVMLLNPYGGGSEDKGFSRNNTRDQQELKKNRH